MVVKYKAMNGARLSDEEAEKYGKRLDALIKRDGFLTPLMVVGDAKDIHSPLHDYFDWNNTEAADKWRVEQAKTLIRGISIIIETEEVQEIRGFYSVKSDESMNTEAKAVYVNLNTILNDDDKRAQVVAYALRELRGWKERYKQYSELTSLVSFIETHT